MSTDPRILLDCRWLDSGGAGRLTELLLRGLERRPGNFRWVLWGPDRTEDMAWPDAELVVCSRDPRQWNGQRSWLDVPKCDLALFLHQQRPLRPLPSVTVVHDTIPLHFSRSRTDRALKRAFLRLVVGMSRRIVTPSQYSKRSIVSDLGAPSDKVRVVRPPADIEMAQRVLALRRSVPPEPVALYLGLFLPHKNLERLVQAFGQTDFRQEGGRLLLIGGIGGQHERLLASLSLQERGYVEARPFTGQDEVERALAGCRFLVLPSLEEGFGLPAWEALAAGVPVCSSDGGALPEITEGWADVFPASSVTGMIEALDRCARRAASRTPADAEAASSEFLKHAPDIDGFAAELLSVVDGALGSGSRTRGA